MFTAPYVGIDACSFTIWEQTMGNTTQVQKHNRVEEISVASEVANGVSSFCNTTYVRYGIY